MRYYLSLIFLLVFIISTCFRGNVSVITEERIADLSPTGMIGVVGSNSANLEQKSDSFWDYMTGLLSGEKYPIIPKIGLLFSKIGWLFIKIMKAFVLNLVFIPFYLLGGGLEFKNIINDKFLIGFFACFCFVLIIPGC